MSTWGFSLVISFFVFIISCTSFPGEVKPALFHVMAAQFNLGFAVFLEMYSMLKYTGTAETLYNGWGRRPARTGERFLHINVTAAEPRKQVPRPRDMICFVFMRLNLIPAPGGITMRPIDEGCRSMHYTNRHLAGFDISQIVIMFVGADVWRDRERWITEMGGPRVNVASRRLVSTDGIIKKKKTSAETDN